MKHLLVIIQIINTQTVNNSNIISNFGFEKPSRWYIHTGEYLKRKKRYAIRFTVHFFFCKIVYMNKL